MCLPHGVVPLTVVLIAEKIHRKFKQVYDALHMLPLLDRGGVPSLSKKAGLRTQLTTRSLYSFLSQYNMAKGNTSHHGKGGLLPSEQDCLTITLLPPSRQCYLESSVVALVPKGEFVITLIINVYNY